MQQRIKENPYLPFVLLTAMTLILLFLPAGLFLPPGGGWFFGSEGDWVSQHVAIADSLRRTMLSSQQILPQWTGLGGGSNIYDFAYYGLLRPDVLFSCLMPNVEMKYFVAGYAALGVLFSAWLCYIWLQKRGKTRWISFAGAVLMVSAGCFYHAHHQIMFVNYMPFLVLALIGVEQVMQKGRICLLAVSVFLILLHSFYYAPASICVVGIYALHRITERKERARSRFWKIIFAIGLAVGMAMIILLPVGLDILSTAKDGGSAAGKELELLDLGLPGLLYSPYGCGMTLVTLYTLILSVRKKKKRFLAVSLLIVMSVPAISLVLNGFLYARAKILIPFVPLLVWVCIDTLQDIWNGRQRAEWIPFLFCLIPALVSEWKALILAEGMILAIWIVWWRGKETKTTKRTAYGFWVILLIPVCVNLGVNLGDSYLREFLNRMGMIPGGGYISAEDQRQQRVPAEKIREFASDSNYRFEILADSYVNCNVLPDGEIQRTSMYSSVSDNRYAEFYYNTMGNAISFNNRVALVAGKNPFFNYFMGVRYLLTEKDKVPEEYQVKESYNDYVLAECEDVLPVCYGTTECLSRDAFDMLEFPDTLEALCTRTIVEPEGSETNAGQKNKVPGNSAQNALGTEFKGHFRKQNPETFFAVEESETEISEIRTIEEYLSSAGEGETVSLKLSEPLHDRLMVIRFLVNRKDGQEVVISVNGMKNKLSAASAPYPNKNEMFTYIFDGGEQLEKLKIKKSAGNYKVEQLEVYTLDKAYLKHENVTKPTPESTAGAQVFRGNTIMDEDGYFVTSYPYRKGYQIFVDNTEVKPALVNTTFLGCSVTEGAHTIEIRFTAPGYEAGRLISIGAWMLWGLILLGETIKDIRTYRKVRNKKWR